ncbi:uncharacterized protein, partial [Eurosta solidaginis]|uniref:uncharacterized protein n=1 Tax=Eurosta solidaginis TaxID=178769 RepID=UPI003530FD5A
TSKMEAQEERLSLQVAQMSSQLEAQNTKIVQLEDKMDAEIEALRSRIQELQINRPTASASNPKVKTPSFDGSVPFQDFKLQFEKTAAVNNWNAEDKVAALFVALKGPAAEILQTIPKYERNSYDALMAAVERRYGSERRKQMYKIELQTRYQKTNETLQEFASDVESSYDVAVVNKRPKHDGRLGLYGPRSARYSRGGSANGSTNSEEGDGRDVLRRQRKARGLGEQRDKRTG